MPSNGQFVDGFRRPSRAVVATQKSAAARHITPHNPEQSKTLMRSAVKKPDIVAPSRLKAQGRTDIPAKTPKVAVSPKVSHASVDAKRLKKASQMVKHPEVSRYGTPNALAAIQRSAPIPAQNLHAAPASSSIDRIQSSLTNASGGQALAPSATPVIPVADSPQHQPKTDIFTEALARAESHKQIYEPAIKEVRKQRRNALLVTAALLFLLMLGATAYLNAPALSLKVASVKAGFTAKLPGYRPTGFNFGTLSYGKGNVTVSYADASDVNRRYDITQRQSNWDSQTLLTNFVESANKAYQTYQQAGRTVYLYGDNTATWVDSGIWYTVNGNSALSRDQILDLAGSL
jgi:hypothetical protein